MKKQKVLLISILFLMLGYCSFFLRDSYLHRDDWKKETTPLPRETIMILCNNFSLGKDHPLCDASKEVYASDFDNTLRQYFLPKNGSPATYEDVENLIGKFRWECKPVTRQTNPEFSYFRCLYDLRGDRYWRYAFYFNYPDKTLYSIRIGSSRD